MGNVFNPQSRKVLYHTFGCKLNFAETATIQETLEAKGYTTVTSRDIPDIIIVNSCSVTEMADKKCRRYLHSIHRSFPNALIVVTGCYAQLKKDEVASLPGVGIVAGADKKGKIPALIESLNFGRITEVDANPLSFSFSCARGDRTRFFLKVQDGCDYRCSYCTIPKARGASRSPEIATLVSQAEDVVRQGGKEIVLTGVNIGDFGRKNGQSFFELIKALDKIEGIERYRISSIEPNLLTDEIIEYCASSKHFMPHFHIPLQSGSDAVLALMRRRYNTKLFRSKIEKIKELIPDAFIGVDIIAGSRGETRQYFEESKAFVESLDISKLHVFAYSERPGTDALNIQHHVDPGEQSSRVSELIELSDIKLRKFTDRFVGTQRDVLLEHGTGSKRYENEMSGFTDNYIKVKVSGIELPDNSIVRVLLGDPDPTGQFVNSRLIDKI